MTRFASCHLSSRHFWQVLVQTHGEAAGRIMNAASDDVALAQRAYAWATEHFTTEIEQLAAAEFFAGLVSLRGQWVQKVTASFLKLPANALAEAAVRMKARAAAQFLAQQPTSFRALCIVFIDKELRGLTGALSTHGLTSARRNEIKATIVQAYVLFGKALSAGPIMLEADDEFLQWLHTAEYAQLAAHRQWMMREFITEVNRVATDQLRQFSFTDNSHLLYQREWLLRPRKGLNDFYARCSSLRPDGSRAAIHWVGVAQDGAVLAALVAQQARRRGWDSANQPGRLGFLLPTLRTDDRRADAFELTLPIDHIKEGDTLVLIDDTIASGVTMRRAIKQMSALLQGKKVQWVLAVMYPLGDQRFKADGKAYPLFSVVAEEDHAIFSQQQP
jgi:adenine/guanine phosphoribosyltransferase-like PRPP-binding protein